MAIARSRARLRLPIGVFVRLCRLILQRSPRARPIGSGACRAKRRSSAGHVAFVANSPRATLPVWNPPESRLFPSLLSDGIPSSPAPSPSDPLSAPPPPPSPRHRLPLSHRAGAFSSPLSTASFPFPVTPPPPSPPRLPRCRIHPSLCTQPLHPIVPDHDDTDPTSRRRLGEGGSRMGGGRVNGARHENDDVGGGAQRQGGKRDGGDSKIMVPCIRARLLLACGCIYLVHRYFCRSATVFLLRRCCLQLLLALTIWLFCATVSYGNGSFCRSGDAIPISHHVRKKLFTDQKTAEHIADP